MRKAFCVFILLISCIQLSTEAYRFKVGVRNLDIPIVGAAAGIFGFNHAVLLLGNDIFEFGNKKGYERTQGVGLDSEYDWDKLGDEMAGTTYVSPSQLHSSIIASKQWETSDYDPFKHNCHDFVEYCLKAIGAPASMVDKVGIVYRDS